MACRALTCDRMERMKLNMQNENTNLEHSRVIRSILIAMSIGVS